jgi:3-phytase
MLKKKLNSNSLHPAFSFIVAIILAVTGCVRKSDFYSASDFISVPKTDVHLHINSPDLVYMEFASKYNFRVVSPNVDSRISVDEQLTTSSSINKVWPDRFAFFGTFSVDSFGTPDFAEKTIDRIDQCMKEGAVGIKIWKNIGMVLKDNDRFVMVDDPAFDHVFRYLEEKNIPVMGHLGEPRNCWLPLDEMTDTANYRYYKSNPQYHMYLHPEAPSYEDQINARDNLLKKHPRLDFIGAHLASLEWSVDEISNRLDLFPNLKIDLSARMAHLQSQSIVDYDKVRAFMIKYQDRILYGTDITINYNESKPDERLRLLLERWKSNWIYLATDSTIAIKNLPAEVKGLHLPGEVIDKIYNKNADRFFPATAESGNSRQSMIHNLTATYETDPVPRGAGDDAADDPAIWINPACPDSSRIVGTDKKGGLAVYNLQGKELHYYADGLMNNIDLRYGYHLGDNSIDIIAASNRSGNTIDLYRIKSEGSLEKIYKRQLPTEMSDEVYGLCMYKSPVTGKFYVFLNNKFGDIEQWEIFADGNLLDGKIVRKLKVATQVEGMVADDENSTLFVGEEDCGIWRFNAEPDAPVSGTFLVFSGEKDNRNIKFDIEGLAIYNLQHGKGYLIASSQGNDSYAVFTREAPNSYLGSFRIVNGNCDGVEGTDGLDVTSIPIGNSFPNGLFVTQDGENDENGSTAAQNFKIVRWDSISVKFSPAMKNI